MTRPEHAPDPASLVAAWPLPRPQTLRPIAAGTNNLSHVVDTPAGAYFLRIYQNTDDPARVRYEHALLAQLKAAGLSFAVPHPLRTTAGETYVAAAGVVAALFPIIPGEHAERGNLDQTAVCGAALGELDAALARIAVDPTLPAPTTFGDLARVHPLVPDPLAAMASLLTPSEQRRRLHGILEDVVALVPDLSARLPRQIIHGDFGGSNALLRGDRVSGVLDFEFSGPDLRAMDLAVGLWAFGKWAWDADNPWPPSEAFAAGYRRRFALTPAELQALPSLMRLREATSLIHWIGRHRQGLTSERDIADRAERLLRLDAWLHAHGEELVRRVANAAP